MNLAADVVVPFPRELVYRTYRDRLVDLVPYLPDVRSIEEKERRIEGPRHHLYNVWAAKADIPAVARRFLRPDMLRWNDWAEWDESAWTCQWRLDLPAMPGVVECAGLNRYHEVPSGTQLAIRGDLVLHLERMSIPRLLVPTVRPVVERIVVAALRPNLTSTGAGVERFLRAQQGAAGAG